MREVWKFPLALEDEVEIVMPESAEPLTVQVQGVLGPMLWALVDPDARREARRFRIVGTGHPVDERWGAHVGSFQLAGGGLVFHVFAEFLA